MNAPNADKQLSRVWRALQGLTFGHGVVAALALLVVALSFLLVQRELGIAARRAAMTEVSLGTVLASLEDARALDGDLLAVESERIRFRELGVLRVICDRHPDGAVTLRSVGASSPLEGDSVLVLTVPDEGAPRWTSFGVTYGAGATCPDGRPGMRASLAVGPVGPGLVEGAPVRSFRVVELARRQMGADWVLALARDGGSATAITPPLAAPSDARPLFRYLDRDGFPATDTRQVAVVEIVADAPGGSPDPASAVLFTRIAPRG